MQYTCIPVARCIKTFHVTHISLKTTSSFTTILEFFIDLSNFSRASVLLYMLKGIGPLSMTMRQLPTLYGHGALWSDHRHRVAAVSSPDFYGIECTLRCFHCKHAMPREHVGMI